MTCVYLSGLEADHHDYPPMTERVVIRMRDRDAFDLIFGIRSWFMDADGGLDGFARMCRADPNLPGSVTFEFSDPRTAFACKMRWA